MELKQRFVMHARIQGGALYCYEILDGEKVIGTRHVKLNKRTRPWTETAVYLLFGEYEFRSAWALSYAYGLGKGEHGRKD